MTQRLMLWLVCGLAGFAAPLLMAAPPPPATPSPSTTLTPQQGADGWLLLFDGESPFAWTVQGEVEVAQGQMIFRQANAAATYDPLLGDYDLRLKAEGPGRLEFVNPAGAITIPLPEGLTQLNLAVRQGEKNAYTPVPAVPADTPQNRSGQVTLKAPARLRLSPAETQPPTQKPATLSLRELTARPVGLKPLFNGKDLDGWKVFDGDAGKRKLASRFDVTPEGELHIRNGPGDLQTTRTYANFLLQLQCKTNGPLLNSGVFFRCMPQQYQNGYEAQIHNGYLGDRSNPLDYGTGAIYRRVKARRVVSNDGEWFTLTVLANGKRIRTWVNGYPTVDWQDDRPEHENPRQGSRTAAGHISLQGHDPTTDILFRDIRLVELPAQPE